MEPRPPARQRTRPAAVVLALSGVTFAATAAVPLALVSSGAPALLLVLALAAFLVLLTGVLWAAVRPSAHGPVDRWAVPALVAATLLLWFPLRTWAEEGQDPWAWLAGLTIAACALVALRYGTGAAGVVAVVLVAGGAPPGGSVARSLLTALGCALTLWLMCQVMVWLLRLLAAAEGERAAQAELAVAQDRLRVSRELHDVLGHRLGLITLKAELTADLAGRDPARAAAEAGEIRRLAAQALEESRAAVNGEVTADLPAQLDAAELVLASAGIDVTVDVDRHALARVPDHGSRLLAVVVREAVTNILRHSDARNVRVTVSGSGSDVELRIVNDGVREPAAVGGPGSGLGLASLAARCAAAGMRLVAGAASENRFEVRVEAPGDARDERPADAVPASGSSAGEHDHRGRNRARARQFHLRSRLLTEGTRRQGPAAPARPEPTARATRPVSVPPAPDAPATRGGTGE